MKLNQFQRKLRNQIIHVLKEQGFKINPHVSPRGSSKTTYRRIQKKSNHEQLLLHKKFLIDNLKLVKDFVEMGLKLFLKIFL